MSGKDPFAFDPQRDLKLERTVDVPPGLVWKAWTLPEYLMQWFCPKPWSVAACEIDLRPGGIFKTVFRSPEGVETPNVGTFLEVTPDRRLIWTDALGPGFRPSVKGYLEKFFITAVIEIEPAGKGSRYTARAIHGDAAARGQHEEMGFHEGWGTVTDQLIALARTLR